jgi:ABC-type lipoprotein release transport system permease subunit
MWLALRVRWRNSWLSSLWLALLIGAVGAFVLAAAASARRVEGAYSTFADDVRPPDLAVIPTCAESAGTGCDEPAGDEAEAGDQVVRDLERLAVVERARLVESFMPYILDGEGRPLLADGEDAHGCIDRDRAVNALPLSPGGPTAQSLPFRLDGALPRPGTTGVVLANSTAEREGLTQGDVIVLAGSCSEGDPLLLATPIELTVTGVAVGPLDIEPPGTGLALEPAFIDRTVFEQLASNGAEVQRNALVWIDHEADPAEVANAMADFVVVIDFTERARNFDSVLATDARLLWLLAGAGAVTGVLMLAPLIAAHVRAESANIATLLALGASRVQIAAQSLAAVTALAAGGALAAVLATPPISTAMPRGFASAIRPDRELWLDPDVTLLGGAGLAATVVALAALPAWNLGITRSSTSGAGPTRRSRPVAHSLLSPSLQSGVQAAIGVPAGVRRSSPWARLVSITLAAATCVASLTYLAGLDRLNHDSSLVGWNWDATISFEPEYADAVPAIVDQLRSIGGVEHVTAGTFYPPAMILAIESEVPVWPWSFDTGVGAVAPVMLAGRAPAAPHEVAIDDVFVRRSGLSIGDTVTFSRPSVAAQVDDAVRDEAARQGITDLALVSPPDVPFVREFEITGRSVLPLQRTNDMAQAAFTLRGLADLLEPGGEELGSALDWLPEDLPDVLRRAAVSSLSNLDIRDRAFYVQSAGEPGDHEALESAVGSAGTVIAPSPADVLSLIVGLNLIRTDRVPDALAKVAFVAATLMLISLLIIALRARQRELAIMRTLGLTNAGVRASVIAHATTTVLVPLMVAVPTGVVLGRWAWSAYARDLDVVPQPVTPWSAIVLAVAGAVLVANAVGLVAGRSLCRSGLHTETRAG